MWEGFTIGSVVASTVGSMLLLALGWFLKRLFLNSAMRESLAAARTGWRRRRYVRVFIDAISGEARANDSRVAAQMLLAFPIAVSFLGLSIAFVSWASITIHQERQRTNQDSAVVLRRLLSALSTAGSEAGKRAALQQYLDSVTDAKADAKMEFDAAAARVHQAATQGDFGAIRTADVRLMLDEYESAEVLGSDAYSKMRLAFWFYTAMCCGAFLWYAWMIVVWIPYVWFRSRFSWELERFALRIQGLASKSELADLVKKEAAVRDEESAKSFVDQMGVIANRHGVEDLIRTFELWKQGDQEGSIA
jgi:hypothetical protein